MRGKPVPKDERTEPTRVDVTIDPKAHKIDSYSFRDRSWRGKRPEANTPMPPMTYSNGVTRDGKIAFNFCGADDPALGVDWHDRYPLTPDQLLLEGWVHRDGRNYPFALNMDMTEMKQAPVRIEVAKECLNVLGRL